MKNDHLVPINVQDLISEALDKNINENERMNYQLRVEAIKDRCQAAIQEFATLERKVRTVRK